MRHASCSGANAAFQDLMGTTEGACARKEPTLSGGSLTITRKWTLIGPIVGEPSSAMIWAATRPGMRCRIRGFCIGDLHLVLEKQRVVATARPWAIAESCVANQFARSLFPIQIGAVVLASLSFMGSPTTACCTSPAFRFPLSKLL